MPHNKAGGSKAGLKHSAHRPCEDFTWITVRPMLYIIMMSRWVKLYVTHDQLEAEMIKDILESGGIQVVLDSAKLTPYPVNVGKMGEIKLLVKEEDREIAEEILRTAPQESSGSGPEQKSS